jgi:hypothetical protein
MVNAYYFFKALDFLNAQFKNVPYVSVSLTDNFRPYMSCNKRCKISLCYRAATIFNLEVMALILTTVNA